jgi:hypothetical protein
MILSSRSSGYYSAGEAIIWSRRVSSGWRVSSCGGGYHLEPESIIWQGRLSSGGGEYHLKGWLSSGVEGYRYHLDWKRIIQIDHHLR